MYNSREGRIYHKVRVPWGLYVEDDWLGQGLEFLRSWEMLFKGVKFEKNCKFVNIPLGGEFT